jgi:hypothetical protein
MPGCRETIVSEKLERKKMAHKNSIASQRAKTLQDILRRSLKTNSKPTRKRFHNNDNDEEPEPKVIVLDDDDDTISPTTISDIDPDVTAISPKRKTVGPKKKKLVGVKKRTSKRLIKKLEIPLVDRALVRITRKQGKGIEPKYMKLENNKKTSFVYWNDVNELVERLRLLVASKSAGHSAHDNEIMSIIEELREERIIY